MNGKVCVFCGHGQAKKGDTSAEEVYGKIYSKAGITAHYFCMLFSSGLSQNGASEKEGVLGFLPGDIAKEVSRGSRLRCSYCKKKGATVGCVTKQCRANFHLACGRQNGSFHQFFNSFSSFCSEHRLQQDVPADSDPNAMCSICTNNVKAAPCTESLRAPCCSKYWYHRQCIQQYARSAGLYFFKCPMCNNKDEFQEEMLTYGIYIPEQDAAWETEPNAFQELLERYQNCDAVNCKCVEGRKYDKEGSKWEIILCGTCGSQGSHQACKYLIKHNKKYICPDCIKFVKKSEKKSLEKSPPKNSTTNPTSPFKHTKQFSSEYPGPSKKVQKKLVPAKFRCMDDNGRMSLSSKSKKSKVGSKSPGSSGLKNKKPSPGTATFLDRYLNKSLVSSSPSSSSSGESAAEDNSILVSYLHKNKLMSAYDLKRAKQLKKKHKSMQKSQSDKIQNNNKQDGKMKTSVSSAVKIEKGMKQQKTLDSWFDGPRPSTSNKATPKKDQQIDGFIKQKFEKTPPRRKKKPYVMESHGMEYLICSPKVQLGKKVTMPERTLKLNIRKNNLVIDMVDSRTNPGWENELTILSSIDADVRVTRNMINTNVLAELATKSPVKKRKNKKRKLQFQEENKTKFDIPEVQQPQGNIWSIDKILEAESLSKSLTSCKSSTVQSGQLENSLVETNCGETDQRSESALSSSCSSPKQDMASVSQDSSTSIKPHDRLSKENSPSCPTLLDIGNNSGKEARYINEQSPSLVNTQKNKFDFTAIKLITEGGYNLATSTQSFDQNSNIVNRRVISPRSQKLDSPNSDSKKDSFKSEGDTMSNLEKLTRYKIKLDIEQKIKSIAVANSPEGSPNKRRKIALEIENVNSPESALLDSPSKNTRRTSVQNYGEVENGSKSVDGSPSKNEMSLSTPEGAGTQQQQSKPGSTVNSGDKSVPKQRSLEKLTNYKFDKQKLSLKSLSTFSNQLITPRRSNVSQTTQTVSSPKAVVDSPLHHKRKASARLHNSGDGNSPVRTEKLTQMDSPSRHTRNSPQRLQSSVVMSNLKGSPAGFEKGNEGMKSYEQNILKPNNDRLKRLQNNGDSVQGEKVNAVIENGEHLLEVGMSIKNLSVNENQRPMSLRGSSLNGDEDKEDTTPPILENCFLFGQKSKLLDSEGFNTDVNAMSAYYS